MVDGATLNLTGPTRSDLSVGEYVCRAKVIGITSIL
jgi:hypothetical protein